MKYLDTTYPQTNIPKNLLLVQFNFDIDTNVEIVNIQPMAGDSEIFAQTVNSMQKYATSLKKKGIKIKPAKNEKGESVSLNFIQNLGIQNPSYDIDLIKYYNYQDFSAEKILEILKQEGFNSYNLKKVEKILNKLNKG